MNAVETEQAVAVDLAGHLPSDEMDDDWISAARAYELVFAVSPTMPGDSICGRAYDGLVAARAKRLMLGNRSFDNSEVPTWFWWARGGAALEKNWASGDFETWIDHRVHCRAFGVEFKRVDIEAIVPRGRASLSFEHWEPGNYASAARCLSEVQKTLECEEREAERLILKHCRASLVPARCSAIRWRIRDSSGERSDEERNVAIPEWFWENCLDHQDAVLNWSAGSFAGRGLVDGKDYKVVVAGVEFEVGAIVEIDAVEAKARAGGFSPSLGVESDPSPSSTPIGRRLSERWRPWVAELVAHIHDHGIPEGVASQGQEELIKAVDDALAMRGETGLARSTVQPIVQAVLDRLRSAGN